MSYEVAVICVFLVLVLMAVVAFLVLRRGSKPTVDLLPRTADLPPAVIPVALQIDESFIDHPDMITVVVEATNWWNEQTGLDLFVFVESCPQYKLQIEDRDKLSVDGNPLLDLGDSYDEAKFYIARMLGDLIGLDRDPIRGSVMSQTQQEEYTLTDKARGLIRDMYQKQSQESA